MQPQLRDIIERVEHEEIRDLLDGVFSDLNRLSGYLDRVKAVVRLGETTDEALFILDIVRSESVRHLMKKDSETCLRFVEDFCAAQVGSASRFFLHRFSCYLEILLKHVSMRSVLKGAMMSLAA